MYASTASTAHHVPIYRTHDRDMQYHTKPQQPKQRQSHTGSMTAAPPQPGTCLHTYVHTSEVRHAVTHAVGGVEAQGHGIKVHKEGTWM